MILWTLFLTFLQIGAVSFGGGYAMIALIREKILLHGWLGEEELMNMIAVSESTPGPIAVNMATFVGARVGGVPGAILATLGVVLPSFLIILAIAALIRGFLKYTGVKAFLSGVRPCVIAMILATALSMLASTLFSFSDISSQPQPDLWGLLILGILVLVAAVVPKLTGHKLSPIPAILLSAGLGMVLYAI